MTTSLDIVDSAVKIGLGALIASASTLVLTRVQHRNLMQTTHSEREFSLLKDVAQKVEIFTHCVLRFWAFAGDWQRARRFDAVANPSSHYEKSRNELFDAFNELTSAEALLLLMGYAAAQENLRAYGEMVSSMRKFMSERAEPVSDDVIADYRTFILRARAVFFEELNAVYTRLGKQ
jgi:hypothetical protein